MAFGIDDIIGEGLKLANKFIKDPSEQQQFALEMERLKQSDRFKAIDAALESARMQTEVNKVEAASADPFTSRARPFIIWMCGLSLGYAAIIDPFSRFIAAVFLGYSGPFPAVDTTITLQVLLGLLGLSGLRSYDKKNGVAS